MPSLGTVDCYWLINKSASQCGIFQVQTELLLPTGPVLFNSHTVNTSSKTRIHLRYNSVCELKIWIRAVFWTSGISAFCIFYSGVFVTKHLTAGSQRAERMGNDLQNAAKRLILHLSHVFKTNNNVLFMWPNHLTCIPFILMQWHWIWMAGCKAEKTQLIQARETQNSEEIHQIYTKQREKNHWALLLVSCPVHSALTQVLSYGAQVSQRNGRVAKSFLFQAFSCKDKKVQCFSACHCLAF